jgi:hydroxypyruvate isomerase
VEWLFTEAGPSIPDRIRAAADAGFDRVEFWTIGKRDVDALEHAIRERGVTVTAFVSEPAARLVDPATHDLFTEGVRSSSALASRIGAENLIVVSGDARPGGDRNSQLAAIVLALRRAAPIASDAGIGLLLEPLNTRLDHPGSFLDSTRDALSVVELVDHPSVRLLYDMYHSIVMDEDPAEVLVGSGELVGHVHIADVPGRHEPGTGAIDWPRQLEALRSIGYGGSLGLEFVPTGDTHSALSFIRQLAGDRR